MEDIKKTDALIAHHIMEILTRYMQHRRNYPKIKGIIKKILKEVQKESPIGHDISHT